MSGGFYAQSKEIFQAALDATPEEREVFAERACQGNAELLAEVKRLLANHQPEGASFLDKPLVPALPSTEPAPLHDPHPSLSAGELVANRFVIVQRIGVGGMGEVYEATDNIRGQRVALKVLRPDTAHLLDAEKHMRSEVALASRIAHPNVCRVNDLYLNEGDKRFLVLSMDLLEGESLSQRMARKERFSKPEIASLARQLCLGIEAAHAAGVIHSDLKPSNVMLTPLPGGGVRAVITDFGVARLGDAQATGGTPSGAVGTPLYMAPEQIAGQSASARSDLYSLCLILFELITGRHPFAGQGEDGRPLNRLKDDLPDPIRMAPAVSSAWRFTLLKGLEREPGARFQSARDLLASFESVSRVYAFLTSIVLGMHAFGRRRKILLAAGIILPALAVVLLFLREQPRPKEPFSSVVFTGLTASSKSDDPALTGAQASLLAAIRQSPHLDVATIPELASFFLHMGAPLTSNPPPLTIREAAFNSARHALLSGAIRKDKTYRLHLELEFFEDPRYPRKGPAQDFLANDSNELFRAIESAASWVRDQSGESDSELHEQHIAPEVLTTWSWQALKLLQDAQNHRNHGDSATALTFAVEALQIDPLFATAQSFRGDILVELRRYPEALEAHRRALKLVSDKNLSGRERYEIEAKFNEDTGDYATSLQTYQAWSVHFPKDFLPHFYLAGVLRQLGKDEESLMQMEIARDLAPKNFVIYPHLAAHYLALQRWDGVAECVKQLKALKEPNWATEVEGRLAFAKGDYAAALAAFQRLNGLKDNFWQGLAPFYIARVQAEMGKLKEAEQTLIVASSFDRQYGLLTREAERRLAICYLAWQKDDRAAVIDLANKAFESLGNPDSVALAGSLLARERDIPGAMKVLRSLGQWPAVPRVERARNRLQTEIAFARNSTDCRKLFQSATAAGEFTPIAVDFSLNAAKHLDDSPLAQAESKLLLAHPDLLLNSTSGTWWATPGLLRLATVKNHN